MGLEIANFLDELVVTNPVGTTDSKSQGDDHLRLLKSTLKGTFPGLAGSAFRLQTKSSNYTLAATDNMSVLLCTAAITLKLPAASTLGNKHMAIVISNGASVTFARTGADTINGLTSFALSSKQAAIVLCDGAAAYYTVMFKGVDVDDAILALTRNNKGPTAPSTLHEGMLWVENDNPSATVWTIWMRGTSGWGALATFDTTTSIITAYGLPPVLPVRQTVFTGPMSSTTGFPNFLPATSVNLNLTTQNVTTSVPFIVTAANGFNSAGAINTVGLSTSNLTWMALTASRAAATPNFLYVLRNSDGTLTSGFTLVAPVYQWSGVPATTNGLFTFNNSEMKGYLGNGTTAPRTDLVMVGEAATDASTVISTVAYVYNGRYDSGFTATLSTGGTKVSNNHNIGVVPDVYELVFENTTAELGFAVGDRINMRGNNQGDNGIGPRPHVMMANRLVVAFNSAGNPWAVLDLTTGMIAYMTAASWKYKVIASRGW